MKNMMLLYEQGNGYYEKLRILQEKEGGGANLQIVMENEFSEKNLGLTHIIFCVLMPQILQLLCTIF